MPQTLQKISFILQERSVGVNAYTEVLSTMQSTIIKYTLGIILPDVIRTIVAMLTIIT
jgi:hypothetical protein